MMVLVFMHQMDLITDSNCVAIDIDWIGDQDNNGFVSIDPNSGTAYITIESYPNIGAASILINDEEFTMNYTIGVLTLTGIFH